MALAHQEGFEGSSPLSRVTWQDALGAYHETKQTGYSLLPSLNKRAIVARLKQKKGAEGGRRLSVSVTCGIRLQCPLQSPRLAVFCSVVRGTSLRPCTSPSHSPGRLRAQDFRLADSLRSSACRTATPQKSCSCPLGASRAGMHWCFKDFHALNTRN